MKFPTRFLHLLTILVLFALVACQASVITTPVPTSTPTAISETRATPVATATLAPTETPTPIPTRAAPALLPRRALFALVDKTSVQFSRDGTRISYLAPFNNALNVWVAPVEKLNDAKDRKSVV